MLGPLTRIGLIGTTLAVATAKPAAPVTFFARLAGIARRFRHHPGGGAPGGTRRAHHAPERIAPVLLTELRRLRPFDSFYLPGELAPIDALQKQLKR
ncbi:hypothetical protein [Hymenobacter sp. UYCo722]|uniref:hypothetical protein n=1 Tax=Hymenobacter sp. UYCo722 TaxID=3156335 RepID=UPI003390D0F4